MTITVGGLITEVRQAMRDEDESQSHVTNSEIMRWFNIGQDILCANENLVVKEAERDSVVGQQAYSVPEGFRTCLRVTYDGKKILASTRRREDHSSQTWSNTEDTATPGRYFVEGRYLFFIKAPAEADKKIKMLYIGFPSTFKEETDTLDIPDQLSPGLVVYALIKAYQKLSRGDKSEVYRQEFEEWKFTARRLANNINRDVKYILKDTTSAGFSVRAREFVVPEQWG